MATTPELHEPQIAAARAQAWHQSGEPLLTLEAARDFLNEHGFVLFAPRPLGAPAPSLVEATLGIAKPSTTAADAQTARSLVARLVGEGFAVPLNLLGTPGDLPDFVVSTSAFPFVFTLRGDKGWKRPPETSGAVKVTPLALRVYEALSERGAMTVGDIVSEIGREVNDSATSRALGELWSLLRVIPVLQQGDGETLWELTSTRFLKAIKAGANAGQPTALSALVSLYLSQALTATEDEIASFLSPLTARSRVRDVLHGLVAGRQLSEGVVEGKTVLYIPDALPDLAQFAPEEAPDATEAEGETAEATDAEAGERIRRFDAGEGGARARNLRGKPAAREGGFRPAAKRGARDAGSDRPARRQVGGAGRSDRGDTGRDRPSFRDRAGSSDRGERPDRPARPARSSGSDRPARGAGFSRPDRGTRPDRPARTERPDRPSYTRPWDEERGSRPPRQDRGAGRGERPDRPAGADRGASGDRPPRREGDRESRPFRSDRPARAPRPYNREGGSDRPARGPRPERTGDRPAPRSRSFPSDRREGGAGADRGRSGDFRPRTPRSDDRPQGDRPSRPRREFGGDRERSGGFDRPRPPRAGGPPAGRSGGAGRGFGAGSKDRPPRRNFEDRGPSDRGGSDRAGSDRGRPGRPPGGPGGRSRPRPEGGDRGPRGPKGTGAGPRRGAPAKGASRGKPAPRAPRPEDEA